MWAVVLLKYLVQDCRAGENHLFGDVPGSEHPLQLLLLRGYHGVSTPAVVASFSFAFKVSRHYSIYIQLLRVC